MTLAYDFRGEGISGHADETALGTSVAMCLLPDRWIENKR